MIHEAYMPVYMGSRFLARTDGRAGPIKGSTRGPRGPKNHNSEAGFQLFWGAKVVSVVLYNDRGA